jgi:Ca2+-binding RTX toxin-like protein
MALINAVTTTGAGPVYALGENNDLRVAADVVVIATSGQAVTSTGTDQVVTVLGWLHAETNTIIIGNDSATIGGHRLHIGANGLVSHDATQVGGTIALWGGGNVLINEGRITGRYGIALYNQTADGTEIKNSGILQTTNTAIWQFSGSSSIRLENSGLIVAEKVMLASSSNDFVRNTGKLVGDVFFGNGDDVYDGRGGTIKGTVNAEDGNDLFRPGDALDDFDGGLGADTLDLRQGAGIKVALNGSFANTGAAKNDNYAAIENILGSGNGADHLRGSVVANRLAGNGGNDRLEGLAGADRLVGGKGKDTLTGGADSDDFVFQSIGDGGDIITDFGSSDLIEIDASAFGAGLVAGALNTAKFRARADNHAQDGNDRFIFRTTDKTLWFDANGNAAGGLTLIADLQAGAKLTAGDIILV